MLLGLAHSSLCLHHFHKLRKDAGLLQEPPAAVAVPGSLDNRVAIRRAIRRMVRAIEDGRLDPQRARPMLLLCRLLIHTARRRYVARRPGGP